MIRLRPGSVSFVKVVLASDGQGVRYVAPALQSIQVDSSGRYPIVIDDVLLSDSIALSQKRRLSDFVVYQDAMSHLFNKSLHDSVVLTDNVARVIDYHRAVQDAVLLADAMTRTVTRPLADSVTVADDMQLSDITKHFSDGFAMNDMVGMADGITLTINRTINNVVALTDSTRKTMERPLADSIAFTDTGFIAMHDYVDRDYVDDDYLGPVRSF